MSFDWAAYRSNLSDEPDRVNWEDADDLGRLSLNAFLAEQSPVRRNVSTGFLRLTGAGVSGHRAPVELVANVMRNFQRLVLASGLSATGFTTLRGRIPSDVTSKTLLHLDGAALPGSLILNLVPATLPSAEIMPDGQAEFFRDDDDQLVDLAVARSVELLNLSKSLGPDADNSPFLNQLEGAGPRVATTLRDLANSLVAGEFETELGWNRPGKRRLVSRLTVPELAHLSSLVTSRELAQEPVSLIGVIHTVSDIAPLRVEVADNQIETIDARNISREVIGALLVGMTIKVLAEVTEDVTPGGDTRIRYAATQIDILESPDR